MAPFGRDRGRIEADLIDAFDHPVRVAILALFTRDTARSLAADDLRAALVADDAAAFGKYNVGQVLYHRARLQAAHLLPTE
jgi:hypothetical protein